MTSQATSRKRNGSLPSEKPIVLSRVNDPIENQAKKAQALKMFEHRAKYTNLLTWQQIRK